MLGSGDGGQEVGTIGSGTVNGEMVVEKVSELRGGEVIEGFVGDEEKLILNSVLDRESGKLCENGGDVVCVNGQQNSECMAVFGGHCGEVL